MLCDIETGVEDQATLVIWFKEGVASPIYTFDAREISDLDDAKHWSDDRRFGGRAYFRYRESPAFLAVDGVHRDDVGIYRCRIDFRHMRTRNTRVNLTVIVPPDRLIVMDDLGEPLPGSKVTLSPRNEGVSLNITCMAIGGRPPPRVTWWRENALLDDSYEEIGDNRTRNIMFIERLERDDLNTVLTCQAQNHNDSVPLSASFTIDMNLSPLWVRILGHNRPLSADNEHSVKCEAIGSRPPPVISWWKGGVPMRKIIEFKTSSDGNRTVSSLKMYPTMEDGGKMLTCRAGNPLIPSSDMEDSWKLDVYHVPIVTLEMGHSLNSTIIREGVDVFFECNIKSNPWVYRVSWRHNGKPLNSSTIGSYTIISNQSLVLQSVTRESAGIYTCVGSNHEGDGESNPVYLDIKFAPLCMPGQQRTYGVARGEPARIICELEANPLDIHYTWKFNNTNDAVDIPANHVSADRERSMATYTPMTELDYGSLLCWGRNVIGMQQEPCVFQITPAGKPDPLYNCSIVNQTAEALLVECAEGFDGGLPQHFVMEVYDAERHALVRYVNSSVPFFAVGGLRSGLGFDIHVFAANSKGRSDPVPLHAYTLKAAEKRTASPSLLNMTPVLGIMVGCVAGLVLLAVLIVLVLRIRGQSGNDSKPKEGSGTESNDHKPADKSSSVPLSKDIEDSVDSQEEKNPDVIPQSNDSDYQTPDEKSFPKLNNAPSRIYASITPHAHSPSPKVYESTGVSNMANPIDISKQLMSPCHSQQPQHPEQHSQRHIQDHPQQQIQLQQTQHGEPFPQQNLQQIPPQPQQQQQQPQQHHEQQLEPQQQLHLPPRQPHHHHYQLLHQLPQHLQAEILLQGNMGTLNRRRSVVGCRGTYAREKLGLLPTSARQQNVQDGNSAAASLPLLHHHHLAAAYTAHPHQPTLRFLVPPGTPGSHTAMTTLSNLGTIGSPDDDMTACAETPLLTVPGQRESTVGKLTGQPDLAEHTTTAHGPRVTATRF